MFSTDPFAGFDPIVVEAIMRRLDDVARVEDVAIPLAVESGSRAWGFPSPDSDYDCRFVYIRRAEHYTSLWPARDVIETPLDAVLDVNGWDLGKLIQLLVKGNAVAIERLQSPIRYRDDTSFSNRLRDLADAAVDRDAVRRHYWHLGTAQWTRLPDRTAVPLKKLFYSLRPAAALYWLASHPERSVAPMHLTALLADQPLSPGLGEAVAELVSRKSVTREMGIGPVPPAIADYIDRAFAARPTEDEPPETAERRDAADRAFRELIGAFAPA